MCGWEETLPTDGSPSQRGFHGPEAKEECGNIGTSFYWGKVGWTQKIPDTLFLLRLFRRAGVLGPQWTVRCSGVTAQACDPSVEREAEAGGWRV